MNVLLVEDDARNAALVRRALHYSSIDANLDLVYDGAEAVEFVYSMGIYKWRDRETALDAVIIDLDIPKLSGLELMGVLRLHARTKDIPLIVLSGSEEDGRVAASERFSPVAIVRKPVAWTELSAAFRSAWGLPRSARRSGNSRVRRSPGAVKPAEV